MKEPQVVNDQVQDLIRQIDANVSHSDVSEALHTLTHLAFNNDFIKNMTGNMNGIEAIVRAMMAYQDNGSFQEDGCKALRTIALKNRHNLQKIRESSGIDCVAQAMKTHSENEAVQSEGCWALVVFCSNNDDNIFATKPYLEVIQHAAKRFADNQAIASKASFLEALLA